MGRERATLGQQLPGAGQGLERRQRILRHRLHAGLAVRQRPPEGVAGTGLPGAALLVAVARGGPGIHVVTSGVGPLGAALAPR